MFLDEVEIAISTIAAECDIGATDELFQAEALLGEVTFVSDLLPIEDGERLVRAIADIYRWLEDNERQHHSRRGRPHNTDL